jgi:hypothetical protein
MPPSLTSGKYRKLLRSGCSRLNSPFCPVNCQPATFLCANVFILPDPFYETVFGFIIAPLTNVVKRFLDELLYKV